MVATTSLEEYVQDLAREMKKVEDIQSVFKKMAAPSLLAAENDRLYKETMDLSEKLVLAAYKKKSLPPESVLQVFEKTRKQYLVTVHVGLELAEEMRKKTPSPGQHWN